MLFAHFIHSGTHQNGAYGRRQANNGHRDNIILDLQRALNNIEQIVHIDLVCNSRHHIAGQTNIQQLVFFDDFRV